MLNVTFVGTDHHNPGDTLSDVGVRALSTAMFGAHHATQVMLRDDVDVGRYALPPADVLVVAGTPWLWDRFQDSPKARQLHAILARQRATLRLVLGAGSCYLPGCRPGRDTTAAIAQLFGTFDAVVCRDVLAFVLCREALGDRALLRPCPSVHAAEAYGVAAEPTRELALVYVDPWHCFGSDYLDADVQRRVALAQVELLRRGADAVCMTPVDARSYRARFGEPVVATRDPRTLLRTLARYRRVVSGRVHGAVPARAMGAEVELFPLDSRALTATFVGCRLADLGVDSTFGQDEAVLATRAPRLLDTGAAAADLLAALGVAATAVEAVWS